MARIKTEKFHGKSQSGDVMEFSAAIDVSTDGVFTANIPDDLAKSAAALTSTEAWKHKAWIDQAKVNVRAQARTMDDLVRFIKAAITEHLAVVVTRERVILYKHVNMTSCARGPDGTLYPNGYLAGSGYEWLNTTIHATNPASTFHVGLSAHVYDKVTFTRGASVRCIYERPETGFSHLSDHPINNLNSFCVEALAVYHGEKKIGVEEMPYTDEAARFFIEMMLAMCKLGAKLDAFLGDREQLQLAINRGAGLLEGPKA